MVLPLLAGMGLAAQSAAKGASERSQSGLSSTMTSSWPACSVATLARRWSWAPLWRRGLSAVGWLGWPPGRVGSGQRGLPLLVPQYSTASRLPYPQIIPTAAAPTMALQWRVEPPRPAQEVFLTSLSRDSDASLVNTDMVAASRPLVWTLVADLYISDCGTWRSRLTTRTRDISVVCGSAAVSHRRQVHRDLLAAPIPPAAAIGSFSQSD